MKAIKFMMLLCLLVVFSLALTFDAAAATSITVAPGSGPPTTMVKVTGSGFDVEEAVDVYWDTIDLALAATNATGKFSATIKVPKDAEPGGHWITAVGRVSGKAKKRTFTVRTNWAQFRNGRLHKGFNPYENVLNPETVGGLALAWVAPTASFITYSSPAVANGAVYVGSYDGKLYAFNAADGRAKTGFPVTTGDSIFSSPAVAGGWVYVGSEDHKLYAFNAATGRARTGFPVPTGGYIVSSPAVTNDVVYVGSYDCKLYAFNTATGRAKTGFPVTTGGYIVSSPAVANGVVYVGSADGKLYAFNAFTGAAKTGFPVSTGDAILSSTAVANGVVYVGSSDGNLYAFSIVNGDLLWTAAIGGYNYSSLAVADGTIYAGRWEKNLYAYNLDAWFETSAAEIGRASCRERV